MISSNHTKSQAQRNVYMIPALRRRRYRSLELRVSLAGLHELQIPKDPVCGTDEALGEWGLLKWTQSCQGLQMPQTHESGSTFLCLHRVSTVTITSRTCNTKASRQLHNSLLPCQPLTKFWHWNRSAETEWLHQRLPYIQLHSFLMRIEIKPMKGLRR